MTPPSVRSEVATLAGPNSDSGTGFKRREEDLRWNLPWSATEADLEGLFSPIGAVHSAAVITDRETGRSRGFGFVEMDEADADKAIAELNGRDFGGRALRVNEAQERQRRPRGNRW